MPSRSWTHSARCAPPPLATTSAVATARTHCAAPSATPSEDRTPAA